MKLLLSLKICVTVQMKSSECVIMRATVQVIVMVYYVYYRDYGFSGIFAQAGI